MNKTVQINLGGMPFTLDDNAYRRLDLYLNELKEYFQYSENAGEILTDIESRLAELLTQRLRSRRIVNLQDVADTIRIMGRPGDFEAEDPMTNQTDSTVPPPRTGRPWDIKTGKRLFRDPDDKVLGGVCSGLAAYFGIADPIWLRVGLVVFTLTFGVGVLAYIVMWILVPEAKTASDRLAMRGENANVNNIASMIERGIGDISDSIKENWEDFRAKKKRSNTSSRSNPVRKSGSGGLPLLDEPRNFLPDPPERNESDSKSKGPTNFYHNLLV